MTSRRTCLAVLLAAACWASIPGPAFAGGDPCPPSEDVTAGLAPLPAVAAALKPGSTLRVLAVGSATMFGPDAALAPGTVTRQALAPDAPPRIAEPAPIAEAASDKAFPRQMAKALEAMVPGLTVDVTVRGGRGMPAAQMLDVIRDSLNTMKPKPQLVLWQTGTVEAVHNTPVGEFAQTLSDGAEAAEQAGANVVLIDPQYSRFLQSNSNLDPYMQALQQAATLPGTLLFHRFDLMRGWAAAGQIDLERAPKGERRKAVEMLHACLGSSLARIVLAAARLSPG